METGKPGLASAPVHISSVAAQAGKSMDIQAPLTAVYIHTLPALPAQPYPQPPAAAREPATLHLAMPPLYSKETLPFLTLHIAGGLQSQSGLSLAAAVPSARPKSAGKHVCPHCGRDCMKPSVLEKHLRCHTGERPYPCVTCGVSFKTQSNLYKHKRTQAHARLSSESEVSSLDSMSSSRETCASSFSLDESGSVEKDATLLAADITCPTSTAKVYSVVGEQNALTLPSQETEATAKVTIEGDKELKENETPAATARHLPLQRQEATLFSKQWESSVSRGKSQSHESTDSGFSESSDHYPSPGSVLPDHSMDSLTESTKEHLEETTSTQTHSGPGQEPKSTAREQEQKTLEERISKLISENTAVVEDKQLENVRPRKTVLSKQGSIDLPMPYTYKDSFHFDMRISKTPNVGLQGNRKDFHSSVPTQQSNTMEHAPLMRSNSLPFSVTLLQPERSSPTSHYQSDYVTLVRRGSSGHINPTGLAKKPMNQHSSTHRPLVRQTAVDGNHATDGLVMNSSVEEACSFSCDGDGGDIFGEQSNRKFRRKKTQKFAYNKWYMYGGGTFKKLYSAEKGGDDSVSKGRKCLTNPEHEIVQGLPRRSSAVHKETTTGSTINFTSSSATVCHQGCPPAKLSLVSAVDFNLKTSKTPLRRNLSLSVLPLSTIGSLVSHHTDSTSKADAGRITEKHTDSTSQLCGAHIPSDRKKQKTDDKIICPLGMKTDPNPSTRPRPSVAGSAPQQDTNLTYINLPKHTQLKAALFPSCIINANTPSVNCPPASSTPSTTKASFLPKYQLKLPNAAEPESPNVVDKLTGTDGCTFTSSHNEETSPLVKTPDKKCGDPVASLSMQICDIKKTFSSTRDQLSLPCMATTLSQAETSRLTPNATSSLTVVCRQFAATTVTTACLRNDHAGLCNASIQPSESAGSSVPVHLPRPVAPVVTHFPATPTITTANNQSTAAAVTAFSQIYPNHTQVSSASDQLSPLKNSSNTPVIPCHIVPFDQMQPDAQNVFHVHTADLQICLQIISDEQLALIEPQIERHAASGLSQRHDVDAAALEASQNKSVTVERSEDGRDHQQESDQSESSPTLKPPLSVQFGKEEPKLYLTELSNSTQATAESTPPEGSSLRPHKYGHVNMVNVTQSSTGGVMSTAASFEGGKSGRSQTSEEEHALSLSRCAEKGSQVSRGGLISQTLCGQHKLSVASLSPSTINQNSTRSERLGKESKLKNQAPLCNVGTMKAMGEASGETPPPLQVELGQTSEPSGSSSSINKCKQLNPHTSIYCSNLVESTLSEALDSSKHGNVGCDRVGPPDDSFRSQERTLSDSQDVISSTHSEKQQFISASSNIQVEKPKVISATSIQSPTAGLMEGCAAQKEPQTVGHGETPGQPDSTDWRLKQSQEAGNTNLQCMEGRGGGGVTGEDESGGIKTDEVPGRQDKAESNCTYTTCLPEAEDRMVKVDSTKNSWLSELHLQHPSQTHSVTSEYRDTQIHRQAPSTSNSLSSSASSSQTSLEMNNFCFSQQHWESSSIHNQQTHILCASNSSQQTKAQTHLTETQNAFSQIQSSSQQTFPHQDQKQGHTAAGNNIPAVSCCSKLVLGSQKSPDVTRSPPTHLPSEPFTYPDPGDCQVSKDKAPNDFNKYQSFFLSGHLHGYQPAECLTSGVRPVQSCQDYTEDTSSSDDEGKLIIEL